MPSLRCSSPHGRNMNMYQKIKPKSRPLGTDNAPGRVFDPLRLCIYRAHARTDLCREAALAWTNCHGPCPAAAKLPSRNSGSSEMNQRAQ